MQCRIAFACDLVGKSFFLIFGFRSFTFIDRYVYSLSCFVFLHSFLQSLYTLLYFEGLCALCVHAFAI
jgi:hypothetical protein